MKTTYTFVGTPLALTDGETYHLQKYVKKGRAAGRIVEWGAFDLDLDALATPVLLDCANCHVAHRESCCEGGFPFPPAQELLPVLDGHVERLVEYLPPQTGQHIAKWGLYESHLETAGNPTIGTYMGNCLFCRTEGNGPACMAHRYALEAGMTPEQLKPLSCLLYPLDLIADEASGRVLVTALTERTERFSRWGGDYRLDFLCANRALRLAVAAGEAAEEAVRPNIRQRIGEDVFPPDRYRPAYLEGRGTLTRLYGGDLWQELDARLGHLHAKEKGQS